MRKVNFRFPRGKSFRYKKSTKGFRKPSSFIFQIFLLLVLFSVYQVFIREAKGAISVPLPYKRSDYRHWVDENRNGINTRNEVLIEESLIPVTMSENGRSVIAGLWVDPYTGKTNTSPKDLDIDHLVPLKNAHISGGWRWNLDKKQEYANDLKNPHHLIAVDSSANRQKGDKSPDKWLPSNTAYRCSYIHSWIEIKEQWKLNIEPETLALLSNCIHQ